MISISSIGIQVLISTSSYHPGKSETLAAPFPGWARHRKYGLRDFFNE